MRDSPSLDILPALFDAGVLVRAYDPKAMEEARTMLPDATIFTDSAAACLEGADVAVVVTEWNEFRALTPAHYPMPCVVVFSSTFAISIGPKTCGKRACPITRSAGPDPAPHAGSIKYAWPPHSICQRARIHHRLHPVD